MTHINLDKKWHGNIGICINMWLIQYNQCFEIFFYLFLGVTACFFSAGSRRKTDRGTSRTIWKHVSNNLLRNITSAKWVYECHVSAICPCFCVYDVFYVECYIHYWRRRALDISSDIWWFIRKDLTLKIKQNSYVLYDRHNKKSFSSTWVKKCVNNSISAK